MRPFLHRLPVRHCFPHCPLPHFRLPTETCHCSSLSIWYPRHYLQFRIGLFFGAASLAGKSSCFTISHIFQLTHSLLTKPFPHRCLFRSLCLCYQLHAREKWTPGLVLDFRRSKDWGFHYLDPDSVLRS